MKKGVQTFAVVTEGLVAAKGDGKAATGPFGVFLEDGLGAGTFTSVGTLDASGTFSVSGTGVVPPGLGVSSLADLVGRRVQLRDGADAVLLETVVPTLSKAKKAKKAEARKQISTKRSKKAKATLAAKKKEQVALAVKHCLENNMTANQIGPKHYPNKYKPVHTGIPACR